jgi:hypothetical protein
LPGVPPDPRRKKEEVMPAKSAKQRRWAFGAKGAAWARKHHFNTKGKLPKRKKKGKKR